MKCLVIYRSKSGYTKRYMEMLSESVGATMIELSHLKSEVLSEYDTVVYAGGVYAGKINSIKKFQSMVELRKIDKIAIVAVGASPSTDHTREKLIKDNMIFDSPEKNAAFFYLQGGFDPKKLNFALRTMLDTVSKSIQKKHLKSPETMTQEDLEFLDFFQSANDHTSAENLTPIINYLTT